jgi:hypothetical protein
LIDSFVLQSSTRAVILESSVLLESSTSSFVRQSSFKSVVIESEENLVVLVTECSAAEC